MEKKKGKENEFIISCFSEINFNNGREYGMNELNRWMDGWIQGWTNNRKSTEEKNWDMFTLAVLSLLKLYLKVLLRLVFGEKYKRSIYNYHKISCIQL